MNKITVHLKNPETKKFYEFFAEEIKYNNDWKINYLNLWLPTKDVEKAKELIIKTNYITWQGWNFLSNKYYYFYATDYGEISNLFAVTDKNELLILKNSPKRNEKEKAEKIKDEIILELLTKNF
jgi:hypothetical protein